MGAMLFGDSDRAHGVLLRVRGSTPRHDAFDIRGVGGVTSTYNVKAIAATRRV